MATTTKSTRLQAKQLSEMSPNDFEANHCCVLFLEDFTYDVVSSRVVIRTTKAKSKSPETAIGEIVLTVKGFMSKVMQIGSKESCLYEQKKLEKALSVMEKKLSDPEDTEEEKDSPIKRKKPKHEDKSAYNELDESDGEIMNDIIAKENEKIRGLLKARKPVTDPSHVKNELTPSASQNRFELHSLKKHVDQVDQKLDAIMDILKSGNSSSTGSSSPVGSCSFESTPERKAIQSTPPHANYNESPSSHPKNVPESVMYKDVDLTKGHIPSKPSLFATQRLSKLFSREELQTCTIDPSEKSGKQKLDPDRINILFEALNKVYGEIKIKKNQHLISQAIKQKCLDKLKEKRRRELIAVNE